MVKTKILNNSSNRSIINSFRLPWSLSLCWKLQRSSRLEYRRSNSSCTCHNSTIWITRFILAIKTRLCKFNPIIHPYIRYKLLYTIWYGLYRKLAPNNKLNNSIQINIKSKLHNCNNCNNRCITYYNIIKYIKKISIHT